MEKEAKENKQSKNMFHHVYEFLLHNELLLPTEAARIQTLTYWLIQAIA
jgi:hypothetical protein